jgi:hypothetical protein
MEPFRSRRLKESPWRFFSSIDDRRISLLRLALR